MAKRIGILGGTFNPLHLAHLAIAEEARRACRLDQVLFLPAADPPHKPVAGAISFAHRLAMVDVALKDHPTFCSSDLESRRPGKSYSVETLKILQQTDPESALYFIIGLDSFRDLPSWKSYRKLFQLANLIVVTRPGICLHPEQLLPIAIRSEFCYSADSKNLRHNSGNTVIFLEETRLDISSTEIRAKVAAHQPIDQLVPAAVIDYIDRHGIYQD